MRAPHAAWLIAILLALPVLFWFSALIDREDPGLSFVIANPGALQCIACIELAPGAEYLLCFNMVGVFVSGNGCRSRSYDLNWPSSPQSIGKCG